MNRLSSKLAGQRASMCYSALYKFGLEQKAAGLALRNKREELDFYLSDQPEYLQKRVKYLSTVWDKVLSGMKPELREAATTVKDQASLLAKEFDLYRRSDYKPRIDKVRTALHSSLKEAAKDAKWDPIIEDSIVDTGGGKLKLLVPSTDNESSNISFCQVFLEKYKNLSFEDPIKIAALDALTAAKKNAENTDFWNADISFINTDTCLPGQPDPIEDLTTWTLTEERVGSITLLGTNRVNFNALGRDETARLTKDFGAGFWADDFEILMAAERTANSSTGAVMIQMLAMVNKDPFQIESDNESYVGCYYFSNLGIFMRESSAGSVAQSSGILIGNNLLKYMTLSRTGSNAVWDAYDDVERTVPFGSTSLALQSVEPYRYVMSPSSFDVSSSGRTLTGYVQDIDFQLAGAAGRRRRMLLRR